MNDAALKIPRPNHSAALVVRADSQAVSQSRGAFSKGAGTVSKSNGRSRATACVRSGIVTGLCLAIVSSLAATGAAGGRPDCGAGANTPRSRQDGFVVGKGEIRCEVPDPIHLRMLVKLQYRTGGTATWRTVASATGEVDPGFNVYLKVPHPCQTGGWRTSVLTLYRIARTDPWSGCSRRYGARTGA